MKRKELILYLQKIFQQHDLSKNHSLICAQYLVKSELIGAKYKDKECGSFGHVSTFSFYSNKQITTGEGVMITTNNKELYLYAKEYHDHGHMNNPNFPRGRDTHKIHGFNYRMTDIHAALGLSQFKSIDSNIKIRNSCFS